MRWFRQLWSDMHTRLFWIGFLSAWDLSGRLTQRLLAEIHDQERARFTADIRARFGPVLAEMGEQRDDPGAVDQLAAEMAEWAYPRKRATTEMLGPES